MLPWTVDMFHVGPCVGNPVLHPLGCATGDHTRETAGFSMALKPMVL